MRLSSGLTCQSPAHSQPGGGTKFSFTSFSSPVASDHLGRVIAGPLVIHLPSRAAWFSYYSDYKHFIVRQKYHFNHQADKYFPAERILVWARSYNSLDWASSHFITSSQKTNQCIPQLDIRHKVYTADASHVSMTVVILTVSAMTTTSSVCSLLHWSSNFFLPNQNLTLSLAGISQALLAFLPGCCKW